MTTKKFNINPYGDTKAVGKTFIGDVFVTGSNCLNPKIRVHVCGKRAPVGYVHYMDSVGEVDIMSDDIEVYVIHSAKAFFEDLENDN